MVILGGASVAEMAAQLIAANIMRGENLTAYFRQDNDNRVVRDEKLVDAIKLAKRIQELSAN